MRLPLIAAAVLTWVPHAASQPSPPRAVAREIPSERRRADPPSPANSASLIYPGLTGDELTAALAATYAPVSTYPYDRARDTLFAAVHMERDAGGTSTDSLRGFYSGHAVWIDPALDPTAAAWASSPRFSTEHLWPENRGASEGTDAHRDMHHLAPVMQSVNSSRSDHPFGEIVDTDADRWWGPDGTTRTAPPPLRVRDLYTEKRNGPSPVLEPREDRAGDAARAMFYVWTVYGPSGADHLDAAFWTAQRDVLLDWHEQDPPGQTEIERTLTIEAHQGTANPFVLDATLASRAFGPPPVLVTLASFTAEHTTSGARIAWSKSAEAGVASFRIDGRADVFGSPWTTWGAVDARGQPSAYGLDVARAASGGPLAVGAYRVGLTAIDTTGDETPLGDVGLSIDASTDSENGPDAQPFTLAAPTPNPAGSRTTATLTLARPAHVRAAVYDALGREVSVVYDRLAGPGTDPGGRVDLQVDTSGLAAGVYALRVTVSGHGAAVDGSAVDSSAAQARLFTVSR
ncbi:endonuclease [Rubricoccus marinus]|uniref:Secretion system C-terminal sorting domain-containing protein n=1 Tax=Rubricoccus marinus TaxID=716817 RepID=A0A259TUT1_9BACT|nr:endonuclease [Rubricoccus marinus]OZC01387.1 hypothetical protein BSZ36_17005 [Rubricoccus marinus]